MSQPWLPVRDETIRQLLKGDSRCGMSTPRLPLHMWEHRVVQHTHMGRWKRFSSLSRRWCLSRELGPEPKPRHVHLGCGNWCRCLRPSLSNPGAEATVSFSRGRPQVLEAAATQLTGSPGSAPCTVCHALHEWDGGRRRACPTPTCPPGHTAPS